MSKRQERIAALLSEAESERELLAKAVLEIRDEVEQRRTQWRVASLVAGGLAAAGTMAYKLFGKSSLSARLGRIATVASLAVGLLRGIGRVRRFW